MSILHMDIRHAHRLTAGALVLAALIIVLSSALFPGRLGAETSSGGESQTAPLTAPQQPKVETPAPQAAPEGAPTLPSIAREGSMTMDQMRTILKRLDSNVQEPQPGHFLFVVNDFQVAIFTAEIVNRMRVMVRIRSAENLMQEELLRITQANLDSALDARYAIGRGVLWSTFIHSLTTLHPIQFIEAIGSTVNLAANYGTSYSSGQLLFGGGDSRAILGKKLIDDLVKKGLPI